MVSEDGRSVAQHWHAMPPEEVARLLGSTSLGLPADEARERLRRDGPNALPEARTPDGLRTLLRQFANPLVYVLLAAAVVSLGIGHLLDSAVIGVVLILNALIGFAQERRAEFSVQALMELAAPRARVIRGARECDVLSRDVVVGDVVALETGTRVPADLRLFSVTGLHVNESLLTGEAAPVVKQVSPMAVDTGLADRSNVAFAGTVVTVGRARGYVIHTLAASELGTISEEMRREPGVEPALQQRLARFARVVGLVVVVSAALAFALGVLTGRAAAEMFLTAIALAVSAVPEGLPVACTIALALGVRRMARRRAIVRRLAAVETLGSTTVIGADKTGTLTENRMTLVEAWAGASISVRATAPPPRTEQHEAALRRILLAGVLTNEAEIYRTDGEINFAGDPTEAALLVAASRFGVEAEATRVGAPLLDDRPFESGLQYSASLRRHEGEPWLFVKGALERVLPMCGNSSFSTGPGEVGAEATLEAATQMGARGQRVLAFATGRVPGASRIPETPEALEFVGLAGLEDPPRPGVREAIAGCRGAGIRVVMITGDHASTALAVGRELGLVHSKVPALTGAQLDVMDDGALELAAARTTIYARVSPEHKLRIVRALQANGEVVAITGDGVNDGPALKAADIGVAMGRSGTDVAREAADIVLVDDNFVSIHAAVRDGRVTFDNIRKVTFFLLSSNAGEVLIILVAVALGWPLPLVAVQLLWLNLVTEGIQHLGLAFEAGEADILLRPPRSRREGLLSRTLWERTALSGAVQAAGTLALFHWELARTGSLVLAQTVALTTLALFQVVQIGNARSEHRSVFRSNPFANPFLLLATGASLLVHVLALYVPATQTLLHVVPLAAAVWGRIAVVAVSLLVAVELHKLLRRAPRRP